MKKILATAILAVAALFASTSSATAGDHCRPCYYYKTIVVYKTKCVPYKVCVTKYDHCGRPYHVYVTKYRHVRVAYKQRVKVYY